MPAEATFRHGDPIMIDYTPGAAVAAGEVIALGGAAGLSCGIAHRDIAASELGALAAGGGVYDVKNIDNAANYAKVYWDTTNNGITTTATANALFGYIVTGGAGGANSTCRALHKPYM
jgi:hypothetical protein